MATRGRKPSTTKKQTDEEKLKERQEWLDFASESFYGQSLNKYSKTKAYGRVTKDQLQRMLTNPYSSFEQLQSLSDYFYVKESIYKRLIDYMAGMSTWDCILIPMNTDINKTKLQKAYTEAANYLEKLSIKTNLPRFATELYKKGEVYILKIADKSSIQFKIIPTKYCLPYYIEDGVCRFVINLSTFTATEDIGSYPLEIQNACALYKNGENKSMFINDMWYPVSNNGFCFTTNHMGGHGIPPFCGVFGDIIYLDEAKELKKKIDINSSTKMVHNKVPLHEGKPVFDPAITKKFNDAVKTNLGDSMGIFSITNPMEAQVLSLNDSNSKVNNLVEEAVNSIFDSAGVSSLLFNNSKASGEALKKSIIVDSCYMFSTILPMFSDYLSWEVTNNTKGSLSWKCNILNTTHDNIETTRQNLLNSLSYGGSKMMYFASLSLSPLEAMNLFKTESVLDLNSLFNPVASSHTMSDTTDSGGRPTNASSGKETSEVTDKQKETQG